MPDPAEYDIVASAMQRQREASELAMTVVGITSEFSHYLFDEIFTNGIDLTYQEAMEDLEVELQGEGIDPDSEEYAARVQEFQDSYEPDSSLYLVGAWVKNDAGLYEIDKSGKNGDFAATYSNGNGPIISVEWSTRIVACHHTSPCYVMADGSGPCGDLDTDGTSVTAYALPLQYASPEAYEG